MEKYYIKTYGCAMNYADSNNIRNIMDRAGYLESETAGGADIIIINSCSIRQQAEDKIMGWGMRIVEKNLEEKRVVITGCMASRYNRKSDELDEKYLDALKDKLKWADFIIPIERIECLPDLLAGKEIAAGCTTQSYRPLCKQSIKDNFQAMIPISAGCDNFCSYCIVPYTRGGQRNYKYDIIKENIKTALNRGYKLITLLGQNVNSWQGSIEEKECDFGDLLKKVCSIEGDFWVNFLSSNPMDWTDKLTRVVTEEDKIMKWLNLAVQSGSDSVLERMNRRYTVGRFAQIVRDIKSREPQFRVYTDIITGFSGESDKDWDSTVKLIKELDVEMVYTGKYSKREGTLAARQYEDDVSWGEKSRREKQLVNMINERRIEKNRLWTGSDVRILIQSANKGVTRFYHDVVFDGPTVDKISAGSLIGSFQKARVVDGNVKGLVVKL